MSSEASYHVTVILLGPPPRYLDIINYTFVALSTNCPRAEREGQQYERYLVASRVRRTTPFGHRHSDTNLNRPPGLRDETVAVNRHLISSSRFFRSEFSGGLTHLVLYDTLHTNY